MSYILLVLAGAIVVAVAIELKRALPVYFKFRGKRIISPPPYAWPQEKPR